MPMMGNDLISVIHIRDTDSPSLSHFCFICVNLSRLLTWEQNTVSAGNMWTLRHLSHKHASREHVLLNSATILEISQDLTVVAV